MANEIALRPAPHLPDALPSCPAWLQPLAERIGGERYSTSLTAPRASIEAAAASLPAALAHVAGASDEQRGVVLLALLDHTALSSDHVLRSGDEARIRLYWEAYHEDLGHVPYAVLHGACRAFRAAPTTKDAPIKWFPQSAELLAWCKRDERWIRALNIAHGLRCLAKATPERDPTPLSDAEQAEVDAKLKALYARLRA